MIRDYLSPTDYEILNKNNTQKTEKRRELQRQRQTDRKTDRQTDRQRQTDRGGEIGKIEKAADR